MNVWNKILSILTPPISRPVEVQFYLQAHYVSSIGIVQAVCKECYENEPAASILP
jgi:hypothetical protein